MKVPYKVSEEYAAIFSTPYVVAEVIGVAIILGGIAAHILYR